MSTTANPERGITMELDLEKRMKSAMKEVDNLIKKLSRVADVIMKEFGPSKKAAPKKKTAAKKKTTAKKKAPARKTTATKKAAPKKKAGSKKTTKTKS